MPRKQSPYRSFLLGFLCLLLFQGLGYCGATRDLRGFRANTLPPNDDGSSGPVFIGFEVNFFGRSYQTLYVNNNGNVTFQGPLSTYIPFGLTGTHVPIIAAFFADVDTRGSGSGTVTYGNDTVNGRKAFGVDFFSVGYYDAHSDRLNSFQIVLIERSDMGPGNFDIEFNYDQVQWDLGDAGRGRGDVAAIAGFSNGTGQATSLFQLPGSMSSGAFLDGGSSSLAGHSLNSSVRGRYVFQARNGTVSFLRITTTSLPPAIASESYSAPPLAASGGVPRYTWSPVHWPPDLGLALNPATGEITGVPQTPGEYQLTVQVEDTAGTPPANRTLILKVGASPLPPFTPFLLEPQHATVNVPVKLVAGLRTSDQAQPFSGRDLPRHLVMKVTFAGQTIVLRDDGLEGDEVAGDGHYTGKVIFPEAGNISVTIEAASGNSSRVGSGTVKVWGNVVYSGGPILLDLGNLKAGTESCKTLLISGAQQGDVPFDLTLLQSLPSRHRLSLRAGQRKYFPGDSPLVLGPNDAKEICLEAFRHAPSSEANGSPWIKLLITTAAGKQELATVGLRWNVQALSFWEIWGRLVLVLLAVLLILFIIYGYVSPHRFPRDLAITFVPDYEDLDTSPQPLSQWQGVGIGFYRDAKAFLHPDFRISGKSKGALAMLKASKGGLWVFPMGGSLYREVDLSDWEEIQSQGRAVRAAMPYRLSEHGPFFRIASGIRKKITPRTA